MTVLYFIIAISVLVVIHEYGHFWVARRCGVKVLRFSVGFGKPFWSFTDKHGTEFSVAPIPLGGYVKMLDEREAPVPEHLISQAFTQKTPAQRIAIAAAGPIANFIFAFFAYWFLAVSGTTGLAPVIGDVRANSPAAEAGVYPGDELIAINDEAVSTWQDVNWQLVSYIGEDVVLDIRLRSENGGERKVQVPVYHWLSDQEIPDPMNALGLAGRALPVPPVLGQVNPGPAQQAGLKSGDRVIAIDDKEINDWRDLVDAVKPAFNQTLTFEVERGGQRMSFSVTPERREESDNSVRGFINAGPEPVSYPEEWLRTSHAGLLQGIQAGFSKTGDLIVFTLESLWKMIAGDVSVKNLSGPITIAKVAGASASGGLESFIGFLALLSVSLGVLNLLPVPMLDGGHILFGIAEWVRGKPLPERVQVVAVQFGLFLLLSLMAVAFYNDISRL